MVAVNQYAPLSFEQANPALTGYGQMNQALGQALTNRAQQIKNQFAPQNEQEALLAKHLANVISGAQAQYAPQMAQAQLQSEQAIPGLRRAQAQLAGNQGAQIQFYLKHPEYLAGGEAAQAAGLLHVLATHPELQGNQGQPTGPQDTGTMSTIPGMGNQSQPGMGDQSQFGAKKGLNMGGNDFLKSIQNRIMYGSPLTPEQAAQYKAYGEGLETQAKTRVTEMNEGLNEANQMAGEATNVINDVNRFRNAYKRLYELEKGPLGGRGPAFTEAAQEAEQAANEMAMSVGKEMFKRGITNFDAKSILPTLKLGRRLKEGSMNSIADMIEETARRTQEKPKFMTAATNKGLTRQEAETLFNKYNEQRPVYNERLDKTNKQYRNSWNEYLSKDAIDAARSGVFFNPDAKNFKVPKFKNNVEAKNWFKRLSPQEKEIALHKLQEGNQNG